MPPSGQKLRVRYWCKQFDVTVGLDEHRVDARGVRVLVREAPPIGVYLNFELLGEAHEEPLGGVVHVVSASEGRPAEIGIKFLHLDDVSAARELLGRLLEEDAAAAAPAVARAELPDAAPPPVAEQRAEVGGEPDADDVDERFFSSPPAQSARLVDPDDDFVLMDMRTVRETDPGVRARRVRMQRTVTAVIAAAVLFVIGAAHRRPGQAAAVPPEPPPAIPTSPETFPSDDVSAPPPNSPATAPEAPSAPRVSGRALRPRAGSKAPPAGGGVRAQPATDPYDAPPARARPSAPAPKVAGEPYE